MASKRFEIDMALNASDVAKGAKDGQKALADLEQAVGDVADASGDAGDDVSAFTRKIVDAARQAGKSDDDIKDALRTYGVNAKEAERAIGRVGDEFKDTGRKGDRALDDLEDSFRDVQRQSEKLSDSVDNFDGVGRRAFAGTKEAAKEATQELGQNLGETVSSIRGDLSDLGQVGQDTLGGLAASLAGGGPAGIAGAAALAAGAVGLGLVTAEIEKQHERVEKLKEYFSEAWREAVEGGRDYIDTATVIGEMNDIIFNPDRADEYKRIQEDANRLGLDRSILLQAAAGDQDALNQVMSRTGALQDEQAQKIRDKQAALEAGEEAALDALHQEQDAINSIKDRWQEYGDISAANQQKARDAAQVTSDYLLSAVANAGTATEAVDEFGNRLYTLPDGREIMIDAKTGRATEDVSRFRGDLDNKIPTVKTVTINTQFDGSGASAGLNRWISQNGGRTLKIQGRYVTPQGWDS